MASLRFRLTAVIFDEDENVASVTAIVRDDVHQGIAALLDDFVEVLDSRRGRIKIRLPVQQVNELFHQVRKLVVGEWGYAEAGNPDTYESLSTVVYGLMEKD